MAYKVLEVKHWSPYDGAFWEWNVYLVDVTHNNRGEFIRKLWPIYNPGQSEGRHSFDINRAQFVIENKNDKSGAFEFTELMPLDDKLWDKLPTNLIPTTFEFFNGIWWNGSKPVVQTGYTFRYKCSHCGKLTSSPPTTDTGYKGNGGTGVEFYGWVSEDHLDDYEYEMAIYWTEEEIRHDFWEWTPDDVDEKKLAEQVVRWMVEKVDWDYRSENSGRYPKKDEVEEALLGLGYSDPDREVEVDPPQEEMDIHAQIKAGQLGIPGLGYA